MSGTTSRRQEAGQDEAAVAAAQPGQPRRWVIAGVAVVVLLGVAAAGAWSAGVFQVGRPGGGNPAGAAAPATRAVTRQNLSATTPVTATLGYAGSYTVTGKGSGTLTRLPSAGQVIRQGGVLWRVNNGTPVVLLYGRVPAWRSLAEGTTGYDVTQLNHDLVALGYASSADISALGWDYYSWETRYAVQQLEEDLGVSSPPGSLPLGSVVFEPVALRVSHVTGSLGGPASGPVLVATSDRHVVTIDLSAAQQSEVKAGDSATVTLPDGSSTPGVITAVGTVASGSGSNAAIPVHVRLTHPAAAGSLDQAPVTVNITTQSVRNVLAQSSGGYAVEVLGARGARHLVPVTVGISDPAAGLVQVTGALTPGQRVVVPSS